MNQGTVLQACHAVAVPLTVVRPSTLLTGTLSMNTLHGARTRRVALIQFSVLGKV